MRQALTVVVPPVLRDMTTVGDVQLELDESSDRFAARAPSMISQASAMIRKYVGREFARQQVIETFDWEIGDEYRGLHRLYLLTCVPIISVDGVTGDAASWVSTDYVVNFDTGLFSIFRWARSISVTYTAGYIMPGGDVAPTLPDDLQRACIDTVAALWHRPERGDPMIRQERVDGVGMSTYFNSATVEGTGLPQSAIAVLDSYKAAR